MRRQHILVDILDIIEMENFALEKLALNIERPLSEASIEARAVLQVINTLYELDKATTQDPAICEYSGLRPVEGYKEMSDKELEEGVYNAIIDELDNRGETDEEKAYRKGYADGYDEGLYDGQYK